MEHLKKIFTGIGGNFLSTPEELSDKLESVKAFVFDWDGVFNNGEKNENGSSNFSEVDSMGINMLRFSFWLQHGQLAHTSIISGERNSASFSLSAREHYNSCYYRIGNKIEALDHFCKEHGFKHEEIAYVYDDVLDISIAKVCGVRVLVNRKSNPLFVEYLKKNNLADYITGAESGNFAVRETCELFMGLNGIYDETISKRSSNSEVYQNYLENRNRIETAFFTKDGNAIIKSPDSY